MIFKIFDDSSGAFESMQIADSSFDFSSSFSSVSEW